MKRRFVLALLCATVLAAAPAAAQAPSAQLTVRVRSTAGDSLPDAQVRVEGTDASARTDGGGRARLVVRPGRHTVTVRHGGYTPGRLVVELAAGSAVEADVDLRPEPVRLRELRVRSQERIPHLESVGFYQRRERGKGHFINREELERNPVQRMSSVMRGLRGVAVVRHSRQFSGSYRLSLARGTVTFRERISQVPDPDVIPDSCPVQYYLDGILYPLTSRGIDEIPVGTLEAVEVFRGSAEVPAEFNRTDAACGVVVMWTRKSG